MVFTSSSLLTTTTTHSTAHCATCCVVLAVPPNYHTTHVFCPPCQSRYARPANPYPVVTSAESLRAATVAYTYSNHPAPAPLAPLQNQSGAPGTHRRDAPRVCMRFGCGARLPLHVSGEMCEACAGAGFIRPPTVQGVVERIPGRRTPVQQPLDLVRAVSFFMFPFFILFFWRDGDRLTV